MKSGIFDSEKNRRIAILLLIAVTLLASIPFSDNRLYWPYMLCAYFIGLFIYLGQLKRLPADDKLPSVFGFLFPKDVWLHRSTINDCLVLLLNFGIMSVVFKYIVFSPETFQGWTKSALDYLSPSRAVTEPSIPAIIFFVLAAMLVSELFFYVIHRAQHQVPVLWELHKVHHSAPVMTPITLYRVHPVAFFLDTLFRFIGLGLALGVFSFFYPEAKSGPVVAGTLAGYTLLNILGGNLHHSHIPMRLPRGVSRFITSPVMHQVHHSFHKPHLNKNYGTLFSVWDWIFGTIYIPQDDEKIVFGLGNPRHQGPYESLWGLYVYPLKQIGKRLTRARTRPKYTT